MEQNDEPNPKSDGLLVRGALAGDRIAVSQVADRLICVPRILAAFDRQRGGLLGRAELEDLVQDTFVRLWEKLEAFPSYSTLEMWAYRFCQYEYLNRLRRLDRRARRQVTVAEPPEPAVHDPEPDPIDWGVRIDAALDSLSEADARLIRAKHFEGRTFDQVAEDFGVPVNTAKARYYRGLAKLRDRLGRTHAGDELP